MASISYLTTQPSNWALVELVLLLGYTPAPIRYLDRGLTIASVEQNGQLNVCSVCWRAIWGRPGQGWLTITGPNVVPLITAWSNSIAHNFEAFNVA